MSITAILIISLFIIWAILGGCLIRFINIDYVYKWPAWKRWYYFFMGGPIVWLLGILGLISHKEKSNGRYYT